MATTVGMEYANFEAKLSPQDLIGDYTRLMDNKMRDDVIMPHEVYNECWRKISAATRDAIWKLLFDETPQAEDLKTAAELLQIHKEDACFYQAADYNKWIVLVRDELLKREMFDFWQNVIVKRELGPCWARDSDLFDDMDDTEPINFYNCAGCKAPWLKKEIEQIPVQNVKDTVASPQLPTATTSDLNVDIDAISNSIKKELSLEMTLEDYKKIMESKHSNDDKFNKLLCIETRNLLWQLLFSEPTLSDKNSLKAAQILKEHRPSAAFYCPFEYNEWIQKVKDELIKRKYFNFWQDVIVKHQLGPCSAADSDYFDHRDELPTEFYKIDGDLNKQKKQ